MGHTQEVKTQIKNRICNIFSATSIRNKVLHRGILANVIANQITDSLNPRLLSKFSRVQIKDGTRFDNELKSAFPELWGEITSDAALKASIEKESFFLNRLKSIIYQFLIKEVNSALKSFMKAWSKATPLGTLQEI